MESSRRGPRRWISSVLIRKSLPASSLRSSVPSCFCNSSACSETSKTWYSGACSGAGNRAARRNRAGGLLDRAQQLIHFERLLHDRGHTEGFEQGLHFLVDPDHAAHGDDLDSLHRPFLQLSQELNPVQARHHEIEYE